MCIHSSPLLFPPKLRKAFVYSTTHKMAIMRQEKNAISLSFVLLFILKSVYISSPLKGLCALIIWDWALSIKRYAYIGSF